MPSTRVSPSPTDATELGSVLLVGSCEPFSGKSALVLGLARHLMNKGAEDVLTAVFALKPGAGPEGIDDWAYEAPDRFLVGYGMDDAGSWRGLPYLGAVPLS